MTRLADIEAQELAQDGNCTSCQKPLSGFGNLVLEVPGSTDITLICSPCMEEVEARYGQAQLGPFA